jgi:GH24 family phage-related lysozyme (muramidase)/uncharacterized protein YvpB
MAELKVEKPNSFTFIKARPDQISTGKFEPHELIKLPHGYTIRVDERTISPAKDGHLKIKLRLTVVPQVGPRKGEKITWTEGYISRNDWSGFTAPKIQAVNMGARAPVPIANGKVLDIAYKSQRDNSNNPDGSCNVTSAAMTLTYYGIRGSGQGQLEDELYEWLEANWLSRHDPNHLKQAIEHFGCQDNFTTTATIADIKKSIDNGNPVIVHGYFTTFGHIIVLIGYNDKGFVCHDPYGEWTPNGYDRNDSSNQAKGEAIVYSYKLIERTCLPDGGCWAHVITRPGAKANYSDLSNSTAAVVPPSGSPRYFKPQEFRSNSIAAKFIGHFEGLKLKQYPCQAGVSTIGIGTTRWHDGGPIPIGATITEEQAISFFKRDAAEFMIDIQRLVDVPLTARQVAVVLSFVYNNGSGAFAESTLLKVINGDGTFEEVREQLRRWIKADGVPSDGLRRRRNAEAMLWQGRDDWEKAGFD